MKPDSLPPACAADPTIDSLLRALHGCVHPKAERLRARLLAQPDAEQLSALSENVRDLLCLSFGCAEAARRLDPPDATPH